MLLLLLLLSRFSRVRPCETPEMAAHQAPPSLGFSRQEHWSGLPFPSPVQESEKWKKSLSHVWLFATPWTAAYQASLSMGFSRQEYWSGVTLPLFSSQEASDQAHLWTAAGKKKLTHPFWGLVSTRKHLQQLTSFSTLPPHSSPSTLFYKRNQHTNLDKTVLWDISPPSSWSAGFLNEVNIRCPNNSSLSVVQWVGQSWTG